MGNLHLVTGYAGTPHVASSDQGSFHEAFIRSGQFVLDVGAKFSASIVTNNQIRVNDGEIMMQGRYVKLTPGAYVDLTIENGAQGYLRHDLVVARYTKNADTGIEECNLVVIKGTPAETNPADPEYTTGIINANGALQNDLPLYRVSLSGLVLEGLTALFETEKSIYEYVKSGLNVANRNLHESVKTLGDLRSINTSDAELFKDGTLIMVQEVGLFAFNRAAVGGNGSDGNPVIAPITGGGAWMPAKSSEFPIYPNQVSSAAEFDVVLTDMLYSMSNNSVRYAVINCSTPFEPFGGGNVHLVIYKTSNGYATVDANRYDGNIIKCTRSRYKDVWMRWIKLPYLDENGKIPLDQLPASVLPASIE